MIACGWCGEPAPADAPCPHCGRNPRLAYEQRGVEPSLLAEERAGRPPLNGATIRKRYREAVSAIESEGGTATIEAIADRLDRSPRTVREWRERFGL